MKRSRSTLLVGGLVLAGLVAASSSSDDRSDSQPTGPGSPEVYAQIAAETDCQALQDTFDRGDVTQARGGQWRKIGISYMDAADARMRAVGCYR